MKILFVNTLYYPNIIGGAERSVQCLAEALAENGDKSVIITANHHSGIRMDSHNGVKIYYVSIKNLYSPLSTKKGLWVLKPFWHIIDTYNPWMTHQIGHILGLERPEIVHTNNLGGFSISTWTAAKRQNIPLVHTLRDYYLLCPAATMFRNGKNCERQCWYCRGYSYKRKRKSNIVDAVAGNSGFILNRHLSLGYFSKTPIRRVIMSSYSARDISSPSAFGNDRPLRLGFLGRLKPNKGIELLLQAFERLSHAEYELWIGGSGPEGYEQHLKTRYAQHNIHFLGFVKPESFFSTIDVLVTPSVWHDPLPRTIFEAYTHGIPVIGSNRGGIPEIIHNGQTGFVFDPDHPDTLLSVVKKVRDDPDLRDRMSRNAKRKSREFSQKRSMSAYRTIYLEVLSNYEV